MRTINPEKPSSERSAHTSNLFSQLLSRQISSLRPSTFAALLIAASLFATLAATPQAAAQDSQPAAAPATASTTTQDTAQQAAAQKDESQESDKEKKAEAKKEKKEQKEKEKAEKAKEKAEREKDKKEKDAKKEKKTSQDSLNSSTDVAFSERVADDVIGRIRDGLEGHSRRLLLSAFDDYKMDGYLSFEDQIDAFFDRYSGFRVQFRILNVTVEGNKGIVNLDAEIEEIPTAGGAPQRKQGSLRLELEQGKKGWRVVDFRDRSFFS